MPSDSSPPGWTRPAALSHEQIWSAIDALAKRYGLTASGLAKRAGLDATTFNRSKRQTNDGRLRWPSTESIAKVLEATGASLSEFLPSSAASASERPTLPRLRLSAAARGAGFDERGRPIGSEWEQWTFPDFDDDQAYALELADDALSPLYRVGDTLIVSPAAPVRRGDRVLAHTRAGETILCEVRRQSADGLELRGIDGSSQDRTLGNEAIAWLARILWSSR